MIHKYSFIILYLVILISRAVTAQESQPELVTDRPDQTESSAVVPAGTLQVESGFILESDETDQTRQQSLVFNTTLLRYGLLDNFELRAGMAYLKNRLEMKDPDTVSTFRGLSPLYAGFKVYITDEKGWIPQVSFIGGLILPFAASEDFKTPYSGISMRFACSHTLSDRLTLGYNLGADWTGSSMVPGYYYSAALGFSISERWGIYAEGYGLLEEKGMASHMVDGGITFLVLPNVQLDASGGLGLSDHAPDNYLSVGLSFRLPR